MRRQLAILSALWIVIFCGVIGAATFLCRPFSCYWDGAVGMLPLLTRILMFHFVELQTGWLILAAVCLNGVLLGVAYRMRDERAARIFHGWALGIQAVALILFACFVVAALSLPFVRLAPVIR